MDGTVALDGGDEARREGVHHRSSDPVEAARGLVVLTLELPPRVERGENDLERGLLHLGMPVHGNPTAVVGDGDRGAVGMKRHFDGGGVAVHRLVDTVVEDLPDEVVESLRGNAADVHAGAFAHGLQALENGDVFGGIGAHETVSSSFWPSKSSGPVTSGQTIPVSVPFLRSSRPLPALEVMP